MKRSALGMIETKGLLPLVEAVDAALKAANVTLMSHTLVGGGLATAFLAGDVGAMGAALAAAEGAYARLSAQGVTHLIPRPAEDVRRMLSSKVGLEKSEARPPEEPREVAVREISEAPVVKPPVESPAVREKSGAPALKPAASVPVVKAAAPVPAVRPDQPEAAPAPKVKPEAPVKKQAKAKAGVKPGKPKKK